MTRQLCRLRVAELKQAELKQACDEFWAGFLNLDNTTEAHRSRLSFGTHSLVPDLA